MKDKEKCKQYLREYVGTMHKARADMIGCGFNLVKAGGQARIEALGLDFKKVREGEVSLSEAQINKLLDEDVNQAVKDAESFCSNFNSLSSARQIVLVSMAFFMGGSKLKTFVKLKAAVEAAKYSSAAYEIVDSRFCTQASRGHYVAKFLWPMMQGGNLVTLPPRRELLPALTTSELHALKTEALKAKQIEAQQALTAPMLEGDAKVRAAAKELEAEQITKAIEASLEDKPTTAPATLFFAKATGGGGEASASLTSASLSSLSSTTSTSSDSIFPDHSALSSSSMSSTSSMSSSSHS